MKVLKFIGVFIAVAVVAVVAIGIATNKEMPAGKVGPEAEALADKILVNINSAAFENIDYIEWTFPRGHHFKWWKSADSVEVSWPDCTVMLRLTSENHSVIKNGEFLAGADRQEAIETASKLFNNDSFWMFAPFKVKDAGTERRLVKTDTSDALLVTYNSGGTTPGDSYLWHMDQTGRPTGFEMWVNIIPVGGVYATWENWKTINGIQFSTTHQLPFGLKMELEVLAIE